MDAQDGLLTARSVAREGRPPGTAITERVVTIDEHGQDVECRLSRMLDALASPSLEEFRTTLAVAARTHDEGKRHPRFQSNMGRMKGDADLAKPRPGHIPDRGVGLRHEQGSAGFSVVAEGGRTEAAVIELGHHGHGQGPFMQRAEAVLEGWPTCPDEVRSAIKQLFGPRGTYEREREALQRRLGVHGLAYLQSLLRAADMQISREGK